ncbi:outer membrane porin GjpA [Mycolicibacter heraklionensis]|uniref:Outer membrane porin GjpA n=1 Tax=Mycolicibacter heraklionensis TaxID=512402 RepID=A0A9X7ZGD1_9MYCO|nr:outer membrane porin GjpA [Mycolicibacter heraklionensis]QZA09004.1 outer membrane porin GjpA [Mycolicibacter heraklionensis]
MPLAIRPYATAGVAIVGAGLVAVTPAAAPLPERVDTASPVVQLTGAWEDVFNAASANLTTMMNNWYLAPSVGMQQFMANQMGYWDQLLNDPAGSTNAINEQIQLYLNAVITGFTMQDMTAETRATVLNHAMDDAHNLMFGQVAGYLPPDIDPNMVLPIIDWLGSPQSAVLMGMLGPGISPWIALMNSITDGDSFGDTLTNMGGAFFNGATLNLDALLPMINDAGFFPAGMTMEHLDFAFGGLLSTGAAQVGPYEVLGAGGQIAASVPAVGGSLFQSVGLEFSGVPILGTLELDSAAIGPIAAWQAWGQTVGALLGSGWDGKGAVVVTPPLAGTDLPLLATDALDDGGMSAAATDWLQDLFTAS